MLMFPIVLEADDNGTMLATCPDLPEVTTFGDDVDDALSHAVDAIEEAIAARLARREDVPLPSPGTPVVQLPTQTALTVLLYRALRERGMAKAELARRLHWKRPQVDRLFNPRHNTRLDQFDAAFEALDMRIDVRAA
ncbi:MAG: type II toxin-antitoxin system HicB family antitoxin [Alphaproteobacteria bacterium]